MAGGVLQIASASTQDIFLTGSPQITFFKAIYRRYTNFSLQTFNVAFDTTPNFGETVTCTIPKNGDLVHKIILSINLPEVILLRSLNQTLVNNATEEYTEAKNNLDNFNNYANYIFDAYNIVKTELKPINADPNVINNLVNYYFTSTIDVDAFNSIKNQIPAQIVTSSDIKTIINNINANSALTTSQKLEQMNLQTNSINIYLNSINKSYYVVYLEKFNVYNDVTNERYNFAWIDKIGHFIYNYIELEIGGTRIDKHYNNWINIWYELTNNINLRNVYDTMIGDVDLLTGYNRFVKPAYNLFIPLNFFFNRHNGLCLPLIAIRYNDVVIRIDFQDLYNCIITDYDQLATSDLRDVIALNDVKLLVDYIFLDNVERKKFAESSHEYLIEQVQFEEFTNLTNPSITCRLDFVRPCKCLFFVIKPDFTVNPLNLTTNPHWNLYSVNYSTNTGNPIQDATIRMNVYNRMENMPSEYYNYLVPLECFTNTPADGINVFSFCLSPEELQPTGECNMGKLDFAAIDININPDFTFTTYTVQVYAMNYNILRIYGGQCGLAFLF